MIGPSITVPSPASRNPAASQKIDGPATPSLRTEAEIEGCDMLSCAPFEADAITLQQLAVDIHQPNPSPRLAFIMVKGSILSRASLEEISSCVFELHRSYCSWQ